MRSVALIAIVAITGLGTALPSRAAAAQPARFSDIADSAFRDEIEWLAAEGITTGCGGGRFCPDGLVTRAQMASFLVRFLDLPRSGTDQFTDDDGSAHEANIEALAAAGLTAGCGTTAFCPAGRVTRAQMATFLGRAARLPATIADYFVDDERSTHEARINGLAAAGITGGCGRHAYCPGGIVTRGQMAAFLYRIGHPGDAPPALPAREPMPACRYDDVMTSRQAPAAHATTLLDTIYRVPSTYAPTDLVDTSAAGANGGHRIRRVALDDFTALVGAARASGHSIRVISAHRSYASQVATFNDWVRRSGEAAALRASARPGHSEHQLGTTLDVTHAGGSAAWNYADWAANPTGAWMRDNAWRFGFVMSYPKAVPFADRCYDYEPWHFRYVGREMARDVHRAGIGLREWIWRLYGP
jgi:D-alanyl-D-alanine carboxypeptidase